MTTRPSGTPRSTRWGDYDRDDPFPLFAQVRAAGPVHEVTLADGHRAWLVVGLRRGQGGAERPAAVEGHARRAGPQRRGRRRGPARAGAGPAHAAPSTRPTTPGCAGWRRPRSAGAGSSGWRPGSGRSSTTCSTPWPRRHRPARRPGGGLRVPAAVHGDLRAARRPGAGPGRPRPVVPHPARPVLGPQPPAAAVAASDAIVAYLDALVDRKRATPGEDLVTDLVVAADGDGGSPSRSCCRRSSS